jgi:hypothetical protein
MDDGLRFNIAKNCLNEIPVREVADQHRDLISRELFPNPGSGMQIWDIKQRLTIFFSADIPTQVIIHHHHIMSGGS